MNRIIVSLAILLATITSQALTVISDLDDTIKISRVNRVQAVYNAIFSTDTFLGMPELMRSFKYSDPQSKLFLVSGSPQFVRGPVEMLLLKNGIDVDGIHLLSGSGGKPQALSRLMNQTTGDVILIGDDQEKDPIYYQQIKNLYPERVKAIYIHHLNKKTLPEGQIGYITAYEVAVHEAKAGRMSDQNAANVLDSITRHLDFYEDSFVAKRITHLLIPTWQKCSVDFVNGVLSSVKVIDTTDQAFLSRVADIAKENCNDVEEE